MASPSNKALSIILKKESTRKEANSVSEAILSELFDKQIDFVRDPSRRKAALTTRRAGKTSMWSRYCVSEAIKYPSILIRIWASSRLRAKQLLWYEFQNVCSRHGIPIQTHETELTIRFINGSEIRLLGADKDKEVQKKRGDKTWMEVVLEAQLFGHILESLVEDVAAPCLFDLKGTFCMEGTPGNICTGYWWNVSGSNDADRRWTSKGDKDGVGAGWALHRWSVLDNPFLPHAADELKNIKLARRWDDSNPTYLREYQGKWVNDVGSMFYKYNVGRNSYTLSELQPWGEGWQHSLGLDVGYNDDMAITVWGWHPNKPDLYEAYSWKQPHSLSADVASQVQLLERRGFNFITKVADTGGGGRLFVEDLMARHAIVFEPAQKTHKYEHVKMLNEDLLTGHVKLQRGGVLEREMLELPVDPDWTPGSGKPPFEDSRFANHACDAGLYSHRASRHYWYKPAVIRTVSGTEEHGRHLETQFVEQLSKPNTGDWWDKGLDISDEDDDTYFGTLFER